MFGIAFSGSRDGISEEQQKFLKTKFRLWKRRGANLLHHGDHKGADQQAHELARTMEMMVVLHPTENDVHRAQSDFDFIREEVSLEDAVSAIVEESEIMLACPKAKEEESPDSRTWQMVRVARDRGIRIYVIYPDGESYNIDPTLYNPEELRA